MILKGLVEIFNMEKNSKIYVAGHKGLVGSALIRVLRSKGFRNLITVEHDELDLRNQSQTEGFFKKSRPEYVFLSAAKVGGIKANYERPAEFIYDNTMIEANIIHSSYVCGVKKLLFLGSSCIYPKFSEQPIREEYLLTGELEATNESYAIAKILGIKMCQSFRKQYGVNYISAMPTNLYGYNDNFHPENSHVLPALIRRFYESKRDNKNDIVLWGSGEPYREFLFADDLAEACVFLMLNYDSNEPINVGTGVDLKICDLAEIIKKVVGYEGRIVWDSTKPDGTFRKLLDVSRIRAIGWQYETEIEKGIQLTYDWFINSKWIKS